MSRFSNLSQEQRDASAARLQKEIEERDQVTEGLRKDFEELTGKRPASSDKGADLATHAANQDTDAELFDRLSGTGELTALSVENPKRFEELVEAKRLAGERGLFQRAFR